MSASRERPNLLLIMVDQMRGDCLGIDGHPVISTPNLDQLAAEGVHFRRGYSECPSCVPARRTLMTGQAPDAQGMVGYRDGIEWDPPFTLAGELSHAGYQTEMIGKLHLWPRRKRYGFDRLQLADSADRADHSDYAEWLRERGIDIAEPGMAHGVSANGWVGRPSHLPEDRSHTFWCVSQSIEFLRRRDPTVPFFLNVSFHSPHPPLTPPPFYYDRYMALDLPEPVIGDWAPHVERRPGQDVNASRVHLDRQTMRRCRAAYYGLINHIDDQLGRLFNYLRVNRLLGNTLILFTSDHGEMLGDHNLFRKTFAYEGSARVPFLMRVPASLGSRKGVVTNAPVGLQDVMPTLLDAAGVPIPDGVTGRSLLPFVREGTPSTSAGGSPATAWREALHGEHAPCYEPQDGVHFLVGEREKYVWYSQTGQEHLFDLEADPDERHDLARTPDARARLASWRQRMIEQLRARPEGFVDGDRLVPGRTHQLLVPRHG
jgi:arylsulfatase